jgi:hypothetical protein
VLHHRLAVPEYNSCAHSVANENRPRKAGIVRALRDELVQHLWLASTLVPWWDMGTIAAAQVEKAQLQAQVAELQANYDGWVKAGMLEKVTRCNPGNRPCVR